MKVTKKILIEYFKKGMFDVDLEQMYNDLKLAPEDLPFLELWLEELIKEGWIIKSKTISGLYEYDPGEKMDFGGIRE